MAYARAIDVAVERLTESGAAAVAGVGNGLLWEYANLSTTWRALITGGAALASLTGAIFTRGLVSQSLGGMAAGSVGALSFAMVPIVARPPAPAGTAVNPLAQEAAARATRALPAGTRAGIDIPVNRGATKVIG